MSSASGQGAPAGGTGGPGGAAGAAGAAGAGGQGGGAKHTAGAFDVRVVIAGLIGLYGVVLLILGLVDYTPVDRERTGDLNANLWSGVVMIVVAVGFVVWARVRPILVDPGAAVADPGVPEGRPGGH